MGIIGEEWILVRPETTGFASKLKAQLTGAAGLNGVGVAAGAALIAGIGTSLFAIGEKFETTYNKIRVATGATGDTFNALKGDVKAVLASTPGTFDQVGAAVSGLYVRTRLTGGALDELAKRQVTLARITKTDVGTNVEATTKLFNKYGIAAKDQGKYLDVIFKASQQAGVGIGDLIGPMQKGGAALQQFGFGIDKSAALIASLTKAGVNVQPALMSLRTAFGKIAKEGGDPVRVFDNLQKSLLSGKDPAKAMAQAMDLLGNRGGLELANAIKSGKFNLDDMLKTITDGKGGIIETGNEVSTIGSKFAKLKNQVLVAVEPMASAMVDFANEKLGLVMKWIERSGGLAGVFQKWKVPILAAAGALLAFISPITAVAVGLVLLYQHNERFRDIVQHVARFVTGTLVPALRKFGEWVTGTAVPAVERFAEGMQARLGPAFMAIGRWITGTAIPALQGFADFMVNTVWPAVQHIVGVVVSKFEELVAGVRARWNDIKAAIHNVLTAIKVVVAVNLAPIILFWRTFHAQILTILRAAWRFVRSIIEAALNVIKGVLDIFLGIISGHWGRAWKGVKEVFSGIWQGIQAVFDLAWTVLRTAISTAVSGLLDWFKKLPGKIINALGKLESFFAKVGVNIVTGIANGIRSTGNTILDALESKIPGGKAGKTLFEAAVKSIPGGGVITGVLGRARGGFVNFPTSGALAMLHGRELVLPLNDPKRSMQLLEQSGLFAPGPAGASSAGVGGYVHVVLAPVFPPGMDQQEMLDALETIASETVIDALNEVTRNGQAGAGTNR